MARKRRAVAEEENTNTTTGGNTVSTMDAFIELSDDDLNSAISGSRSRGVYDENLMEFLNSGRRGVQVNLEEGIHEGKKAQSVKTGYESARVRLEQGKITDAPAEIVEAAKATKVIGKTSPDRVFLVRTDVAAA
jgi:hypothetical protein